MREKRYRGDVRHQSPHRSRARDREYSPRRREIGDRPFDQSLGSAADESERSRRMDSGSGSAARRVYDSHYDDGDRDRDVQSRRLSEFNEGLSRGDSTAMKFQWKHLLAEPAKLSVESTDVDYSLNRSIDGSIDGTDRNYQEIRYSDTNQKNYQDIRYSDTNRTGMLFEKPFSVEADRGRSYSFHSPDHVGVSRSSGHLDDGFSLPSLNLNLGLRKNEPFDSRIQTRLDKLLVDKSPEWELYKEERNSMVYSKDPRDYKLLPFSGSKAIGTDSKEDIPAPLKGYGLSPEMNSRPLGHDGYRRVSRTKSPVELSDRRNYHRAYRSPTEEKHGDGTYLDGQRSVRGHMGTTSEEFHGNMLTIGEKYGHRDSLRTSIVDPIVDRIEECSHREQLRELRLSDHIPSSQGQESPDYLEVSRSLHVTKQEREVLYLGNTHREYKRDVYQDHGSLLSGEGHGYESGGDPWTREDSCEMLPMAEYDPYLDVMDGSSKRRSTDGECSFHESSRTILKRKRAMDEKSSMLKFGSKTSSTGKSARRFHDHEVADERRTGEDRKPLFLSKKSRFSHSKYGKTGSASNETASHGTPKSDHWSSSVNVSVSIPRHVSKHHSSRGRDIKKRLGPGPQNTHVSHPLGKNDKSLLKKRLGPQPQSIHVSHSSVKNGKAFVKKRLGPGPQKFRVSLPWLKNYQHCKFPRKIQRDGSDGGLNDEGGDGDPLEGKLTIEKAEPPERSEDFKQLVHHAFFRFVRHLNENSGQRRRYMEQGKAGTLKCNICGSVSEEFLDTESLAVHAFSSPKVGCRSQHLGFHKALCVLMGWKTELGPGSPWVREILSDAETLAVKDDLIIWPPVVVVHNSSIGNKNPGERVIVSIELLESILKDMGFGEKTKVCRGKAANQSIMVVKFNATFSGFQEAERLHSFYAETKHGRAEFQHLDSTGEAPADKVEHVLYGHLGLAADLDKLDFETKKRCVVKSKREIQNIADAPLKIG